ncbi:MAG: threonylcarbamoyl-AMP synthase [Deltaproteobacteria bacterium]|nr:MAG: threonylcarbamoyl-AMP synthase [Deltaproteobacteria bacterium]
MSEHLYTHIDPPDQRHLDQIVDVLRDHGVIALGTGTNWAFVADPTSRAANEAIRRLKPTHPKEQPFSLLCASIAMATEMAMVDATAYRVLKRAWPGPFTVLLPANRALPRLLKTKRKVVGCRVPDAPLALAILEHFGGPLMATTVPRRADGSVLTMGYEVFETHGHGLDLVVDLGDPLPGTETTVVDMSSGAVEIIREGAGDIELL